MSGPYCESCVHFHQPPLSNPDEGECTDPLKIIEGPTGDDWNSSPFVHKRCSCRNHETKP
jgi:hypothetical protein